MNLYKTCPLVLVYSISELAGYKKSQIALELILEAINTGSPEILVSVVGGL